MPNITFKAPVRGWIRNEALNSETPQGAEMLDNFFPTTQSAMLRSGKTLHATVTGTLRRLFEYRSGSAEEMFAATETAIYDVTAPADPAVSPSAAVSSLTSGDWSAVQFSNSSGEYVVIANGADSVRHYNGTTWATPSITGVTSADLSQVWTFKERLFFVEGGTMSFWYLPVNAVAGAATEFPLSGVFSLGGSLLFGATWSLDSGSGIDDVCVLVTTEGEVAIYQGTDPSSSSTWSLQGVYRIAPPLDKNGWAKLGADLAIMTEDGIITVAEALNKSRGDLAGGALTFPIEDAWREAVSGRSASYNFTIGVWPSQTKLIVGTPSVDGGKDVSFVANMRTGAWCRYTGWDVRAAAVYDDDLYFGEPGSSTSEIFQAESGGNDNGVGFEGKWVPKFYEGDSAFKSANHARLRARASGAYTFGLTAFSDYSIGSFPVVLPTLDESSSTWGTGTWGTSEWGGNELKIPVKGWKSVRANGNAIAPGVVIPSNRVSGNTVEVVAIDMLYEQGSIIG